jgi:hypothetical protein
MRTQSSVTAIAEGTSGAGGISSSESSARAPGWESSPRTASGSTRSAAAACQASATASTAAVHATVIRAWRRGPPRRRASGFSTHSWVIAASTVAAPMIRAPAPSPTHSSPDACW